MTEPYRWPDIQVVLRGIIAPLVGGIENVGPQTPADLNTRAMYVRAVRTGGPNDELDDLPSVEIDVFAPTYAVAQPLAEDVRQLLMRRRVSPLIDKVLCNRGPVELDWGDATMRRFSGTYEFVLRRHRQP